MIEAFEEGYKELENGDVLFAKNLMRQSYCILNQNGHPKPH